MDYQVLIIGGGLSGLTAGALLSKRGLKVGVIDKNYNPGGACGIFKRKGAIFDQGAAMLYGFGPRGFNAHRFVFNQLEEPIDIIKHDLLYRVNYDGRRIDFCQDLEAFVGHLGEAFPEEKEGISRFYKDMAKIYRHVMQENPSYTTPDEVDPATSLKQLLKHPVSYLKFISYLNRSARSLLEGYFKGTAIFNFFDKMTSTYCYATVEEAPAILASVMFIENHVGGSYYPFGSTLNLPGKLEKVIEENGGDMLLEQEVVEILFEEGKAAGVRLVDGSIIMAEEVLYTGTVWALYDKLIPASVSTEAERSWAASLEPTYPSVVLYALVRREAIPKDTQPVEMLVGNPESIDESEVTAYIFSIEDQTLCDGDHHVITAIGPSLGNWKGLTDDQYQERKNQETERLLGVLEKRFPGLKNSVEYKELATPRTIEYYLNKKDGSVAGPKQMLGQHMFKRLHTRSRWPNLYFSGESTIMGTGTPTVTTSAISASNVILKKRGMAPYVHEPLQKNYVRIVKKPYTLDKLHEDWPREQRQRMLEARKCQLCTHPSCALQAGADIRGAMRRVAVGNFAGALKCLKGLDRSGLPDIERSCILNRGPVPGLKILEIVEGLYGEV